MTDRRIRPPAIRSGSFDWIFERIEADRRCRRPASRSTPGDVRRRSGFPLDSIEVGDSFHHFADAVGIDWSNSRVLEYTESNRTIPILRDDVLVKEYSLLAAPGVDVDWERLSKKSPDCRLLHGTLRHLAVAYPRAFEQVISASMAATERELLRRLRDLAELVAPGGWLSFRAPSEFERRDPIGDCRAVLVRSGLTIVSRRRLRDGSQLVIARNR